MLTVSSHRRRMMAVAFSGWITVLAIFVIARVSAAGDPQVVRVGKPDDAPGIALLRDVFHGKFALNWEIVRADKEHFSLTKNPGKLTITTQRGSIHGDQDHDPQSEGIRAKNIFLVRNPVAEDTDFSITLAVSKFKPTTYYQQVGLICYDDDENYVKWSYEYSWMKADTVNFVMVRETDMQPEHDLVTELVNPGRFWMRITKRGNEYECAYSTDGRDFKVAGSRPWGKRPPKYVGFLAKNGGNPQAGEIDVCIDSFELRSLPDKDAKAVVKNDARSTDVRQDAEGGRQVSLDGTWTGINLQVDGRPLPRDQYQPLRMVFAKGKVTLRMRNKTAFDATYKVDAGKTPHAIDFLGDAPTPGIYRLEADKLTIGLGRPDQQRPDRFDAGFSSSPQMLIELQRGDFIPYVGLMTMIDADDTAMHKLIAQRRFDFRNSQLDRKLLHFHDAEEEQYAKTTPEGLLLAVPAGQPREEVGVLPQLRVHGDFEITASFEIRELDEAGGGFGVGPQIWVLADGKEEDAVSLGRMRTANEGDRYILHRAIYTESVTGRSRGHAGRLYAAKAQAGQFRLVRFGNVLRVLVADAQGKEFRQLGQIHFSTADIKTIDIGLKLHDTSTAAAMLWKDVTIRAEGLVESAGGKQ